jgi:hypothetical protein
VLYLSFSALQQESSAEEEEQDNAGLLKILSYAQIPKDFKNADTSDVYLILKDFLFGIYFANENIANNELYS